MIKIYISYFYQIRFFKKNMIPISTALYDPKWYYNGHQGHFYKDHNGVYNGLRADILNPPKDICGECGKDCGQQIPCNFMLNYKKYLNSLDFSDIIHRCENIGNKIKLLENFTEEPIIVLMVHEKTSCKCAERPVLQEWFKENKSKSPYFRNMYHNHSIAYIASGLRDQNSLGSDLIFAVI